MTARKLPPVRVLPPGVELIPACPIWNVRVGDHWVGDKDDVAIDKAELFGHDEPDELLVTGRIIRGTGRGNKARTWRFFGNQTLSIERGHS